MELDMGMALLLGSRESISMAPTINDDQAMQWLQDDSRF